MQLYKKRLLLTSQVDISKLQKQLRSVIQSHLDQCANFGPLSTNACDSKPQHNSLKVTRIAAIWNNYINEASKPNFANIFFKLSYHTRKVCFSMGRFVSLYSINEIMTNCFVISKIIRKLFKERPVLIFQFDVSKLQKQLWSVIRNHLDQSAIFAPLTINVCNTVSRSITR